MIFYTDFDYSQLNDYPMTYDKNQKYAVNAAFGFDIETTTIDTEAGRKSFMYIWQFGINGTAVYGRTWAQFADFLKRFSEGLYLNPRKRAIVYIHNAGFEFEFMQGQFEVEKVFARSAHHPIYFTLAGYFIEFRDSQILSGLSLAKTAENLTAHSIRKMVGDLDYSKIRNSQTELTPEELKYCENDVLILNAYIDEEISYNGSITKIPLTRTGYARRRFRNALKKSPIWKTWKKKITRNYPTPDCFSMLFKCFAGGYVHANYNYVNLILEDVYSIDFSSSYPAQMVRHKYPLGQWIKIKNPENISETAFTDLMSNRAIMCDIIFADLEPTTAHHILSRSKCVGITRGEFDNGRVVSAQIVRTYLTDVDYKIMKMFYNWSAVKIVEMWICDYEYLPTPFVAEVLNLFEIKTSLKGVEGKEVEYMRGKGDLNSGYGMSVTNPVNDEIIFERGEWKTERGDFKELLEKNKKSHGYFLPYSVGVWVTAWARYELLLIVRQINDDVVYDDTDSAKILNFAEHKALIDDYNARCCFDIETALTYHGIPLEKMRPKTKKGVEKVLGVFEVDAKYQYFKTLGCKRYCYTEGGRFGFTASGVPKGRRDGQKMPIDWIEKIAAEKGLHPMEVFDDGLSFPAEYSGKLTHYYVTEKWAATVTDYQGHTEKVSEGGGVVLVAQPYAMSLSEEFKNFLLGRIDYERQINVFGKQRPELKITMYD